MNVARTIHNIHQGWESVWPLVILYLPAVLRPYTMT